MSFIKYKDIPDISINEKDYLKTGIKEFDRRCLGFGKGQLIIITGTRGGGKTSLLGQLKLNFIDNGYSCLTIVFRDIRIHIPYKSIVKI